MQGAPSCPGDGESPRPQHGLQRLLTSSLSPHAGRGRGSRFAWLALLAIVIPATATRAAGDAAAGRQKALACQTCHGLDGLSKLPQAPHLAGQPEQYLAKALDDYRKGARKNEMMSLVAPALSDQDVADLAAYYAGIAIEVKAGK